MGWLIGVTAFLVVGAIVKMILDHATRRRLIDKGLVDENVKYLFYDGGPGRSSLKWGMVLVGIGLALLIEALFPYDVSDEMMVSFMFLFAGVGLLLYYTITPRIKGGNSGQQAQ